MPYFMYFDSRYIIVAAISLVLMISAQIMVKSRISKYSKISNARGITGQQAAQMVLDNAGVTGVYIVPLETKQGDHYDPRDNTIRLSQDVYFGATISAVGIAAHEAGHAVQKAENYTPMKLRHAMIPISNFGPSVGIIMLIMGAAMNFNVLITAGLVLFSFAFIMTLITLPVEFNASRRALNYISVTGALTESEQKGAKSVLSAAAMTYVAAMLQSLLTLLYYIVRFTGNRRR